MERRRERGDGATRNDVRDLFGIIPGFEAFVLLLSFKKDSKKEKKRKELEIKS